MRTNAEEHRSRRGWRHKTLILGLILVYFGIIVPIALLRRLAGPILPRCGWIDVRESTRQRNVFRGQY